MQLATVEAQVLRSPEVLMDVPPLFYFIYSLCPWMSLSGVLYLESKECKLSKTFPERYTLCNAKYTLNKT